MNKATYKVFEILGKIYFKKPRIYGLDNYKEQPSCIFMCNHEELYGPCAIITRFPIPLRLWAYSGVVEEDESINYIKETFLIDKLKMSDKYAQAFSRPISKLVTSIVGHNNPIVAYWDPKRAMQSILMGVKSLIDGENQLMFAKSEQIHEDRLRDDFNFMKGYLFVVQKAMKSHGICPTIFPMAINKNRATIAIGKPIIPNPEEAWNIEKNRINSYLVESLKIGYMNPEKMIELQPNIVLADNIVDIKKKI